jgi:hypothetical protein
MIFVISMLDTRGNEVIYLEKGLYMLADGVASQDYLLPMVCCPNVSNVSTK